MDFAALPHKSCHLYQDAYLQVHPPRPPPQTDQETLNGSP